MLHRIRTAEQVISAGSVINNNTGETLAEFSYKGKTQTCDDWYLKTLDVNNRLPPSDFAMDTITCVPAYLSGGDGTFGLKMAPTANGAYIPSAEYPVTPRGTPGRIAENNLWSQTLLAKTNPFRADFSVPVFAKELVELSKLFKIAAGSFAGFVGSNYLNYRFGWAQFNRDVQTLSHITEAIARRVRELDRLSEEGGLRRRIPIDSLGASASTTNVSLWSTWGFTCKANRTNNRSMLVYGTVRWKPTQEYSLNLQKLDRVNLAFRKVSDLEAIDAVTAWQLIPWSWLTDYFTGISDFLEASNGRAQLVPHDICIMRKFHSVDSYRITSYTQGLRASGIPRTARSIKYRDCVSQGTFPAAPIDLLDWSQWKVILALFLTFGSKLR